MLGRFLWRMFYINIKALVSNVVQGMFFRRSCHFGGRTILLRTCSQQENQLPIFFYFPIQDNYCNLAF